jgi:hypothetical protein
MTHIFLRLLNCYLCVFNSLSYPRCFSLNIIHNLFLFLFIAWEVCFSSFLCHKLLFGLEAPQCPKCSEFFCVQPAIACIRLTTSLGWTLCRFARSAYQKLRKVLFQNIGHCSIHWLCCWVGCWMSQYMENVKASCVFYVKVGTLTPLEQSTSFLLTVNKMGIVRLTVQYDSIVSVDFMYYPGDNLKETSADVLSLNQSSIYSCQSCDVGCRIPRFIAVNKQPT